jgi:hypothetical protein
VLIVSVDVVIALARLVLGRPREVFVCYRGEPWSFLSYIELSSVPPLPDPFDPDLVSELGGILLGRFPTYSNTFLPPA